jgi:hypothetical protein
LVAKSRLHVAFPTQFAARSIEFEYAEAKISSLALWLRQDMSPNWPNSNGER